MMPCQCSAFMLPFRSTLILAAVTAKPDRLAPMIVSGCGQHCVEHASTLQVRGVVLTSDSTTISPSEDTNPISLWPLN